MTPDRMVSSSCTSSVLGAWWANEGLEELKGGWQFGEPLIAEGVNEDVTDADAMILDEFKFLAYIDPKVWMPKLQQSLKAEKQEREKVHMENMDKWFASISV